MRAAAALALLLLMVGCGGAEPPLPTRLPPPPLVVVLITVGNLRADAVEPTGGPVGSTPALAALAAQANFVGTSMTASTSSLPALASLLTGLTPSRHGVASWELAEVGPNLPWLPATLAAAGVATSGWVERAVHAAPGWQRGFSQWHQIGRLRAVREALAAPPVGASFSWVQLPGARPGWQRGGVSPNLLEVADLPARLSRPELAELARRGAFDQRRLGVVRSMYRSAVWGADGELGMLLAALQQSPRWDDTLLMVTSDSGFLLGEGEHFGAGHGLTPAEVEVPLLVRLPPRLASGPPIDGAAVSSTNLAATILEAFALPIPPAMAPPLGRLEIGARVCELPVSAGTRSVLALVGRSAVWRVERFASTTSLDPLAPDSLSSGTELHEYLTSLPWRDWSEVSGGWGLDGTADPVAIERARLELDRLAATAVTPADTRRLAGVSAPLRYTEQASPVEVPGP